MISFGKKKKLYTLISNARIVFAEPAPRGGLKTVVSLELDDFLQGRDSAQLGGYENELLIVPDFWVGVKPFLISSNKRSVIELFVKRKLRAEAPDIPEVEHFFDYVRYRDEQGREGVQVYHLLEVLFAQLHRRLVDCGLRPGRVTTPGLLWEGKLGGRIADFAAAGIFLVNVVGSECFFYFFHRGRYLFSRDISFSEHLPAEDRLDALSFEIDQSRFLFAQKAKAEIDRIYLVSSEKKGVEARALAERLGKATEDLNVESWADAAKAPEELNALLRFSDDELSASGQFINLAHRLVRQELEWQPVQNAGLAVGCCLLLLLLGQTLFLQWWPAKKWQAPNARQQAEQRQTLRKFNADLDLLLQEARRPRITDAVARLARALPESIRLEQFTLAAEPAPLLALEGQVRAAGAERLQEVLALLEENLKTHFPGSAPLKPADMEIGSVEDDDAGRFGAYRVKLRFTLP